MHAFLLSVHSCPFKAMFPLPDIKSYLTDFKVFNEHYCVGNYREDKNAIRFRFHWNFLIS